MLRKIYITTAFALTVLLSWGQGIPVNLSALQIEGSTGDASGSQVFGPATVSNAALPAYATTTQSRDQEITFTPTRAVIVLRSQSDGQGLAVYTNGAYFGLLDLTDGSKIKDAVQPGLNDLFVYGAGSIIENDSNYTSRLTGYPSGTFSLTYEGFGLILKWNGATVKIWPYMAHYLKRGKIEVYTFDNGDALPQMTITHLSRKSLYSNTDQNKINIKDFVYKFHTKGTMSVGGSNQITVADASGIPIGADIFIACGGESVPAGITAGYRGSIGVGGAGTAFTDSLPNSLIFANRAAMLASTSFANGTTCVTKDSGLVHTIFGGVWFRKLTPAVANDSVVGEQYYYENYAMPRPLKAKVIGKVGNVLTLNAACVVPTTNADVWIDNHPTLVALTTFPMPKGTVRTLELTLDTIILSNRWFVSSGRTWSYIGQGESSTLFYTPLGGTSVYVDLPENTTHGYFTADGGNNKYHYSKYWWPTNYGGSTLTGLSEFFTNLGSNIKLTHVTLREYNHNYFNLAGSHSKAEYITLSTSTDCETYSSWKVASTGNYDTVSHLVHHSPRVGAVIETFGGVDNLFEYISGTNISFSSNGGVNMKILHVADTITTHSWSFWNGGNQLINYNNNNGYGSGVGGVIKNIKIHHLGYMDTVRKYSATAIAVQSNVSEVVVDSITVTADASIRNLSATNITGLNVQGANCTVSNISVIGNNLGATTHSWNDGDYSVTIASGTLSNCTATSILIKVPGSVTYSGLGNSVISWFQLYGVNCGTTGTGCSIDP